MRAKEFTINVPIKVQIGDDEETEANVPFDQESEEENHRMVPPLQQAIELQKASLGKESDVIDDLIDDEEYPKRNPNYRGNC